MSSVHAVVEAGAVHAVFQPVVDPDAGTVVAYEARSRGPARDLERADALIAAAAQEGLLADLDAQCRRTVLTTAASLDWPEGVALFVNVVDLLHPRLAPTGPPVMPTGARDLIRPRAQRPLSGPHVQTPRP